MLEMQLSENKGKLSKILDEKQKLLRQNQDFEVIFNFNNCKQFRNKFEDLLKQRDFTNNLLHNCEI